MNLDLLRAMLERHEGRRNKPYSDIKGKVSIGIGRNLTDVGLRNAEIDYLYMNDVSIAIADLEATFPWFDGLDDVRQRVFVDVRFNLGMQGMLGFKQMLLSAANGQWAACAAALMDSDAARELPGRYHELSAMLVTGRDVS